MGLNFKDSDHVLLVRSAWIGDFIVCLPFIEHLVTQVGIPKQNIGFLILNAQGMDPVKAILGSTGFAPENCRTVAPSPLALVAAAPDLRALGARFNRIVYLPFQGENKAARRKKWLAFKGVFGLGRTVEGLQGGEGPGIRISQYYSLLDAHHFPTRTVDYLSFLELDSQEREAPDALLRSLGPGLKLADYPNSKLAMKIWPRTHYIALIRWLRARYGAPLCLIGGKEDRDYNQAILAEVDDPGVTELAGRLSIRQTIRLLAGFDLLLGNDGAPLHMGALAGVPIIGLYGCKAPLGMWDPVLSSRVVTLQRDVECRHCQRTECPAPICVQGLTVADVVQAVELFLDNQLPNGSYLLDGPFDPVRHRRSPFELPPDSPSSSRDD